jgi:hypothetical protein
MRYGWQSFQASVEFLKLSKALSNPLYLQFLKGW